MKMDRGRDCAAGHACALLTLCLVFGGSAQMNADDLAKQWLEDVLALPSEPAARAPGPRLELIRQDFERLELGRSVIQTPLRIGERDFRRGLGTHSVSRLRLHSDEPIQRFSAFVGVDHNERTSGGRGSVVFSVRSGERELYRSGVLRGGDAAERVEIDVAGATALDLHVDDADDGPSCDHADWAEAIVTTRGGDVIRLDEIPVAVAAAAPRYPFSFAYDDNPSDELLDAWPHERREQKLDGGRTRITTVWTDPQSGLRVQWEAMRFSDFPAVEWALYFESVGEAETSIIENVQALDVAFSASPREAPFRLHETNGAPSNPTDFEAASAVIDPQHAETMGGGGGRSSNRDFPFFKLDTGDASAVIAVGWSGQWQARVACPNPEVVRVTAGLERTHFRLRPGERVRSPRMLVLYWDGDTWEANAQFRQLIYKHYVATREGEKLLPTPYCNTCFTRGGGWLNECSAENQISLIRAYAPLGLEALLTDAGWFEGGWPAGAGNWTPRKDAYPDGMGPVAAAARENGMVYGLWFEPERVVSGTWLHENHPEWCLSAGDGPQQTYLLNFGLPEVQEHFFGIVEGFMDLPGFRVYRQDFNLDPLPYWRHTDAPDRVGMTEMKYVEGMYAYWDRIAGTWPDSLRIECASGGRRIDLETIRRMHIHQKSDYWFDNEVDQASIWGLSQYLPNNVFMAPINRMDDYSFHSAMATSVCLGWIADAPDFDFGRAEALLGRYRKLRHLLIGAWYPLLPYSRRNTDWIASQYHRPDLDEGMILAFRRADSRYLTIETALRGLEADGTYELTYESAETTRRVKGAELMAGLQLTISEPHRSELIVYRRADAKGDE